MRIYELGDGTPEVAVVGGIHGDEPCGPRAIERFVAEEPAVDRPVKLVVANEEALDSSVRYLDEDLNRAFPGDPDADSHEGRLAHHLLREVRDCTTLSLHSTQSHADPFALVTTMDAAAREICPRVPVEVVVETEGFTNGRLIQQPHTVEVECGLQGSDEAAENAYDLLRAFLDATGVHDGGHAVDADRELDVFRLVEPISKPETGDYEVYVDNFERVEAGAAFAAVDGEELVAERSFYPILLSAYGYRDIFGYVGERVDF
jgi:succinylglutamate desuccinylase